MTPQPTRAQRVEGGLVGLLVGDALGVPYEFSPAQLVPPMQEIEFRPPASFDRSHATVPPATWSDDGAQALCLLESLLDERWLDLDDFASRLVEWHDRGRYAVDGFVYDCGIQTTRAVGALRDGVPPEEAGPSGEQDNGNGSLMRVLPLALWHTGDDAHLVRDAERQSLPTHGHRRSRLCCALYCLWARRTLQSHPHPWDDAVATLRALRGDDAEALAELEGPIGVDREPEPTGSGYVVGCLQSARFCLRQDSYEAVVKTAVSLGDDTDTTAAVAGGLAGVRHGIDGIPERWRRQLRGREILMPILDRLLA